MTSVIEVLRDLAGRYDVQVRLIDPHAQDNIQDNILPADLIYGPGLYEGISFSTRTVVGVADEPERLLHELTHLILGRWSLRACEGALLIPFEWRLVHWVTRRLPNSERRTFFDLARMYQESTSITCTFGNRRGDIGFCVDNRRRAWYRRALVRAQTLGLLDRGFEPTFRACTTGPGRWLPPTAEEARLCARCRGSV